MLRLSTRPWKRGAVPNKLLWLLGLLAILVLQLALSQSSKQPVVDLYHASDTLCSNDQQLTQGRWTAITLERPPYIPQSPRVRCMPIQDFYRPFSTHRWTPHGCRLTDWNATQFARRLSNRTIAFIGDSLTLEHYASLVHLLGDRARLPPKAVQHKRIQRRICHERDCVDVVFATDFALQAISQEVERSHPTVLVLNRGAHYVPDDQLLNDLQEHTFPAVSRWNRQCQSTGKCLLVWRTTVPGHPHCHNFTQPADSVEEMQTYIQETSTKDDAVHRKGEYHWRDFQRQNRLVVQLWTRQRRQWPHIRLEIMDSYRTNILRPDHHRSHMNDCLHSCSPGGGSDLNSQWLLHILVLQQQQQL